MKTLGSWWLPPFPRWCHHSWDLGLTGPLQGACWVTSARPPRPSVTQGCGVALISSFYSQGNPSSRKQRREPESPSSLVAELRFKQTFCFLSIEFFLRRYQALPVGRKEERNENRGRPSFLHHVELASDLSLSSPVSPKVWLKLAIRVGPQLRSPGHNAGPV